MRGRPAPDQPNYTNESLKQPDASPQNSDEKDREELKRQFEDLPD